MILQGRESRQRKGKGVAQCLWSLREAGVARGREAGAELTAWGGKRVSSYVCSVSIMFVLCLFAWKGIGFLCVADTKFPSTIMRGEKKNHFMET